MSGNERDVCRKEARRTSANPGATLRRSANHARQKRAGHEKREANASAAKERCDSLSGQAKDDCSGTARQVARGDTGRTGGTGVSRRHRRPGSTGEPVARPLLRQAPPDSAE
jgi:hypothetical protein